MIRPARSGDAQRIADIYNHYVLNTTVTFEEEAVVPEEMAKRIADYSARFPWLVHEEGGEVLGYAYAAPWRPRSAYRHSAEATVYVDKDRRRGGIGSRLYGRLLAELRGADLKALMAGIALPNEGSVGLHEKLGFRKVGHFEDIGYKFGRWIDVGYWEYKFRDREP